LKKDKLIYNAVIYTQAGDIRNSRPMKVDSMAVSGRNIVAVGNNLDSDPDFKKYQKINAGGKTIIPGFVDSHTHFLFLAQSLGMVDVDGIDSLEETLVLIKKHVEKLSPGEWVVGKGFSPDRWKQFQLPDKYMLDKISGNLPALIFSKDQHMIWVNSKALEIAGVNSSTPQPEGGLIEQRENGEPSGILKEGPAMELVLAKLTPPGKARLDKLFGEALEYAYSKGVTGVHSFDSINALDYFDRRAIKNRLGLRIYYYPPVNSLGELRKRKIQYGYGNDYFKICGIKIFADGSLGSQTALTFNKYQDSEDNYGVEVTPVSDIIAGLKKAASLNLPAAIHAIGDKAVANVLDSIEKSPELKSDRRHRIEHVQMIRRKDIGRLKRMNITASMQPSHCPSDIKMINKYWGKRGRNCYIFKTLYDKDVPLAFGSDAPIEPLDPIAGIDAAVNRKGSDGKIFYPDERLSIAEAVYGFTAGPAYAVGEEYNTGKILPGYKADFIVLSENIYNSKRSGLKNIKIDATFFDGQPVYMKNGALSY